MNLLIKKQVVGTHIIKTHVFVGYAYPKQTWSRLKVYVLGPKTLDSSSKTTYIVLFPGLNSTIQVKIPQHAF